jgi:hypothetical protein
VVPPDEPVDVPGTLLEDPPALQAAIVSANSGATILNNFIMENSSG